MHTDRYVSRLTKGTLALILAGGRGSRLNDLTLGRAKPAVPFGGKFRIIDFALSNCINSGIRRIGILTQYKSHSLIRHIHKGWGFLRGEFDEYIELLPPQQDQDNSWYQGTADAVFKNIDIIRSHQPAYILILAADHIYKMDYGPLIATHVENQADMTIGSIEIPLASASAFGVMSVDADNRVLAFTEKPTLASSIPDKPDTALASMGIYVFSTDFLLEQLTIDAEQKDSSHDFGMDIIPKVIGQHRVFAYPFRNGNQEGKAYWRDVGTVDAYWQANIELIEITPDLNLYDREWPIWTCQQHSPPCKFVFDDDNRRGTAIDSMISGGCIVSGAHIKRSLLFNDVLIESGSKIREAVILPDVKIGRNCRISRAVIDNGVVIADNTIIGENLELDRQRFHVSPGGITLVTPAMLGQAAYFDG